MVDVDGVLIVHPDPSGWSVRLEQDLGIAAADLQRHFFAVHWDDVVHGRARLHDRLALVLADIAPHIESETLVDYWFAQDANFDRGLLEELRILRGRGFETHLATVQEHERANYLWDTLRLCEHFDGIHYAAAMGCSKPDIGFFKADRGPDRFCPERDFLHRRQDREHRWSQGRGMAGGAVEWGRQAGRAPVGNRLISGGGKPAGRARDPIHESSIESAQAGRFQRSGRTYPAGMEFIAFLILFMTVPIAVMVCLTPRRRAIGFVLGLVLACDFALLTRFSVELIFYLLAPVGAAISLAALVEIPAFAIRTIRGHRAAADPVQHPCMPDLNRRTLVARNRYAGRMPRGSRTSSVIDPPAAGQAWPPASPAWRPRPTSSSRRRRPRIRRIRKPGKSVSC